MGDYDDEGGQWIGGEYFAADGAFKKRKFTKEDAIYGIFNDEDSSDDDGSNKRSKPRSDKNLKRPVAFVSTGNFVKGENTKDEESDNSEDDYQQEHGGLGLGAKKKKKKKKVKPAVSVEENLPTSFGTSKSKRKSDQFDQQEPEPANDIRPEFEKFTKGIGSKLLAKMGYTGGGLGVKGQGIVEPVAVKQRPKNLGIGNMDEKTEQQKQHERRLRMEQQAKEMAERGEEASESESDEDQPKSWRKGAAPRRKAKTVYEVLNADEEDRPQKILDMRGPQPRVVTSTGADAVAEAKKKAGPLPELRFNLRLLVDLAEVKIQNSDRRQKQERDRTEILKQEQARMEDQVKSEMKRIERLQEVLDIIAKCEEKVKKGDMQLDYMKKVFDMLRNKYKEEYVMHRLKFVAGELVGPLLKRHMISWDPQVDPTLGADLFGQWRKILEEDEPMNYDEDFDIDGGSSRTDTEDSPYMVLIMDVFMTKLRSWMSNQWSARNYDPVIQIIGAWGSVLPPVVLDNVIEQLIMPKLTREVENWNPRTDTVPIHAWLHPWLPILQSRMEPLYPPIRNKLAAALRDWNALDPSAHAIITPWVNVFDAASMEALLVRAVLPKLIVTLREFVVNPLQQYIEPFQSVMIWADLVPIHHFIALLEGEFFGKWLQVLFAWLMSQPDYEEVTRWYLGWKKFFPQHILNHDRVRMYFNLALEAMNQAVSGTFNPNNFVPPPPSAQAQPAPTPQPQQPPPPPPDDLNLKQVVEDLAVENGVSFVPTRRKHENGAPIYSFGGIHVHLEKGKVFLYEGSQWRPISPEALVARAKELNK